MRPFTGALVLPRSVVSRLGLTVVGSERYYMIGDRQFEAEVTLAEVEWLGAKSTVRVIVDEVALLGAELLERTKLIIDYAGHTVTISHEVSVGPSNVS
jgi:predicted aspartyl protease